MDPNETETDGIEAWFESPSRYTRGLVTDGGHEVVYSVASVRKLSRLKFDHGPGERVARGRRSGFFYFATRIDVLLPEGSTAAVAVGDRVRGGSDVIAHLSAANPV